MTEEFSVKQWLADGVQGVRESVRDAVGGGLLPEEYRQHMRASRKEFVLAFRSLFDAAIQKMEAPKSSTQKKATKIKVE